ncbi:unnamed protein product [Moneuplotes crassus]|uniref:Uncharacterized protein n=1 Tax=Euplotes crassus TaxID=5936 RepID=A0AAD2D7H0_EUPCR|nr:unnamed protein product [Moneuplotes crassus]
MRHLVIRNFIGNKVFLCRSVSEASVTLWYLSLQLLALCYVLVGLATIYLNRVCSTSE